MRKGVTSLTVNKKPWEKIKKQLVAGQRFRGRVGWFADNVYGPENDNLPVATVANWNEYGGINGANAAFPGAVTPPRPFMRVYYQQELRQSRDLIVGLGSAIQMTIAGKSPVTALEYIGPFAVETLKDSIYYLDHPPNSQVTIDLKNSDNPLIDTGTMMNSVNYRVGGITT